jgi:hypothetical protein
MRQDQTGDPAISLRMSRVAAPGILLFALSITFAAFDWIMSIDPHWFSTMFSVHNFAGSLQAAVALTVVCVIALRRWGRFGKTVKDDHLHDLGRLLFGFSCFWAYIWFCQFMLIWYANIPEETGWFVDRLTHGWQVVFLAVPVCLFLTPFAVLMRREAKRSEGALLFAAAVVLIGRWIELYLSIVPSVSPSSPVLGASEIGGTLLGAAVLVISIRSALGRASLLPSKDPYVEESLSHHVGQTM